MKILMTNCLLRTKKIIKSVQLEMFLQLVQSPGMECSIEKPEFVQNHPKISDNKIKNFL